jgi:hypothetical protein
MRTGSLGAFVGALVALGSLAHARAAAPPVALSGPIVGKPPPTPIVPVFAPAIASISVSQPVIATPRPVAGVVTFASPATADGFVVVSSSNGAAAGVTFQAMGISVNPVTGQPSGSIGSSAPAASSRVPVSRGATTAAFQIVASSVSTPVAVTITASGGAGGKTATTAITVNPYAVSSFSVPADVSVYWDRDSTVQGRVFLAGAAPSGGRTIRLGVKGYGTYQSPSSLQVPATVVVPAGASNVTFPIQVLHNDSQNDIGDAAAQIVATDYPGVAGIVNVHQRIVPNGKVSVSPSVIQSGQSATVTATLDKAAPPSGYVMNVNWMPVASSFNQGDLKITIAQLVFQPGQTTASTTLTTTVAGPKLAPSPFPAYIQPSDSRWSNQNYACVLGIR